MGAGTLPNGIVFADLFRIESHLADGGMGVLYEATHTRTGSRCALKVLSALGCFDDEVRTRFIDEARNTPSDESDHIVRVFDTGFDHHGIPWISMELLIGDTLTQHIAKHGVLDINALHVLLRQLCHGVGAAHARGIVHRDLKPDNIFLHAPRTAKSGRIVKVLDFGVAKVLGPSQARMNASIIAGTAGWWAPEQQVGGRISPSTDVWAIGLIAYWCLTRAMLPEERTHNGASASMRARIRDVDAQVPPWLAPWFARCTAPLSSERFRDAHEAWKYFDTLYAAATQPTMLQSPSVKAPTVTTPTAPPMQVTAVAKREATHKRGAMTLIAPTLVMAMLAFAAWQWWPTAISPSVNIVATSHDDVFRFLRAWNAQLDALARREPADLSPFYAEHTRLRGLLRAHQSRAQVTENWRAFFQERGGTTRYDWSRASLEREVLDATRDSHSACNLMSDAEPDVWFVRVYAIHDDPMSGIERIDGTRCTHIEGEYLLRMRRVGGTYQICHDTWSLGNAICTSCPDARVCVRR